MATAFALVMLNGVVTVAAGRTVNVFVAFKQPIVLPKVIGNVSDALV